MSVPVVPELKRAELLADFEVLKAAVIEAAVLSLSFYKGKISSWRKHDDSPVSEADIAVNDLLQSRLRTARPDYGWLSEETEDDRSRLAAKRTWVVDPIDGTRAFLKGKPEFTIVAALVENGSPIAAAVAAPAHNDLYEAVIGGGARKNDQPIKVTPASRIDGLQVLASDGFVGLPIWKTPWPSMTVSDVNSIALRLCLVAEGRYHAAMRLKGCHDWDLAAAHLILSEAGGTLTTHEGKPFAYNGQHCTQGSFVAGDAAIHAKLCAHIVQNFDLPQRVAP